MLVCVSCVCDTSRPEMTYMANRQKRVQLEQNFGSHRVALRKICAQVSFLSTTLVIFFLLLLVLLFLVYCSLESNQISYTEAQSLLANQKVSGLSSI